MNLQDYRAKLKEYEIHVKQEKFKKELLKNDIKVLKTENTIRFLK
ncbi:MAG: hypothetical protein PHG08_01050 [Bacilli bacterium]|nr:hypothetical protein [Bacilli bacterium]